MPFLRTDQTGQATTRNRREREGGRERGALIAFESGYHTVHQLPVLHGSDKIPLVLIIFR